MPYTVLMFLIMLIFVIATLRAGNWAAHRLADALNKPVPVPVPVRAGAVR